MNPIKQGLMNGTIKVVTYGNTIHVYSASQQASVDKDIKRALYRGESLNHPDGSREFVTFDAIHDIENDEYIWDKSGDKVKHNIVLHIISKDSTHTTEIIGTSFRKF